MIEQQLKTFMTARKIRILLLLLFLFVVILCISRLKARGSQPPSSWYQQHQTCQISEPYMLRPTGVAYSHGKLFLLGRSYEKFYSVDLYQPTCQVHPITGGQSKGFVVPLSMFFFKGNQSWYVVDPATGIIVVNGDDSSHMLKVQDPVTHNQIDPSNGFAQIDKDHVVVVDFVANRIVSINLTNKTAQILSSDTLGSGPKMRAPISVTYIDHNLYVLDYKLKSIFEINPQTGDRSIYMKLKSLGATNLTAQQPFILTSLYLDDLPFLLISDPQQKSIFKINITTHTSSVLADNDIKYGPKWLAPFGMASDNKSTLFVTDYAGNAVYTVNLFTGMKHKLLSINKTGSLPHLVFPAQLMMSSKGQLIVGDERLPGIMDINPKTGRLKLITGPSKGSGPIMLEVIALNKLKNGQMIFSDTVLGQFFTVDANGNRHILNSLPSKAPKIMDPWAIIKNTGHPEEWYITDGGGGSGNIFSALIDVKQHTIKRKLITTNNAHTGPKLDNTLGLAVLPKNQLIVANSILHQPTKENRNLIAVDRLTGKRKLFSGRYNNSLVGTGPNFQSVTWLLLNHNQNLYVSDFITPAIFLINSKTGNRQYVYQGKPFKTIAAFALSPNEKTMYITDVGQQAIYALNLKDKTTRLVVKSK